MFKSIFAAGFLSAMLLVTSASEAYVMRGSSFEERHQSIILQALKEKCSYYGDVEVLSSSVEELRIDQGIVDRTFTTVLQFKMRVDQLMFETYEAKVISSFYDHYDHSARNWGLYVVDSVSCVAL